MKKIYVWCDLYKGGITLLCFERFEEWAAYHKANKDNIRKAIDLFVA